MIRDGFPTQSVAWLYVKRHLIVPSRPEIKDRIGYLTRQDEELIAEKRHRIEETLWAIHEANVQDLFETYEQPKTTKDGEIETDQNGQMRVERRERPRLISELSPDIAKLIEDVAIDSKGRAIPKLYSKLQASKELRAMLNIGRPERESDISRLSDAELIAQLADQAKELGIKIDLNYRFAQKSDE